MDVGNNPSETQIYFMVEGRTSECEGLLPS